MSTAVGFVGLGDMGSVLAGNLVASGADVTTHDIAGPGRSPDGARFVDDLATLAQRCDTVVFSLPDGAVSEAVAGEIIATPDRSVRLVIDTSTVGLDASERVASAARRRRDRLRRRTGVRRRGRRPRPHARRDVRRSAGGVRRGRTGARRPQRSPVPGRRRPGNGAGAQARQQLPLGHGARRHERGDRLRHLGRPRHGDDARGPERVERAELGDERQVRQPRDHRPVRVGIPRTP